MVDDWRLNGKGESHSEETPYTVAPPLLSDMSLSKDLHDLARKKLERSHARKQGAKSEKVKTDKYVPHIPVDLAQLS